MNDPIQARPKQPNIRPKRRISQGNPPGRPAAVWIFQDARL